MAARGNKHRRREEHFEILQDADKFLNPNGDAASSDSARGKLFLVSTPIGDYSDMTIRALNAIENSDYVICEDTKITSRLLRFFEIRKEMRILDEHNEEETAGEYIRDILAGKTLSLVSDCGTPVFADPGLKLVRLCIDYKIPMEFVHGANSVISAVVTSGFDISRFYFYGFLSPKKELRSKELDSVVNLDYPVILMDTPYRMMTLINDIKEKVPQREISLAVNLSTENEKIFRGTPEEVEKMVLSHFGDTKPKAEFVLVMKNN
ncbi:MAG: SAM-dependent methyltransferase [Bacteroidetes bacterium]|nr:SAM-dependent methyltransferase [Bacteroidota bacterium]